MGKWRTWQPAEVEKLQALAGELPMPLLLQRWNTWARRMGMPPRTEASLRRKALELGLSLVPRGEWVAIGAAARQLGRSIGCLQEWTRHGWLRHRRGVIWRPSLVALARERPHLFAGCNSSGLRELLQDQELADGILAAYPRCRAMPCRPRPVECLTTGQVFPSLRAAGRALYLDGSAVALAVRKGREAAGLRFRLVT